MDLHLLYGGRRISREHDADPVLDFFYCRPARPENVPDLQPFLDWGLPLCMRRLRTASSIATGKTLRISIKKNGDGGSYYIPSVCYKARFTNVNNWNFLLMTCHLLGQIWGRRRVKFTKPFRTTIQIDYNASLASTPQRNQLTFHWVC